MNAPFLPATVGATDKGLYLGHFAGDFEPSPRLRYKGQKHALTFGPTGCGKSTSLVVPNLATLPRSMIVIDPKGQLAAITARKRAKMGRVIVLNPFRELVDLGPHMESAGWKPLAQLDPSSPDFDSDARVLTEACIDKSGNSKSEFFETSMENLWSAFCMWERRTKGKAASLRNVREEFSRPSFVDTLKKMAACDDYAIRVTAGRAYARLTDQHSQSTSMQDVIETVMKNTAFLNDPRLGLDMQLGGAIDFAAMHREITTIYVILPVGQLRKQGKWLRMFVNLALSELFKSPPRVATLPPVLFMLDEFGNLGRLPEILNALNIARDYRVQLWMFLQNLQQLKASYRDEWTYFFSGAGAITSFAARDWETAEHLSNILGKREVEMTSTTNNQNGLLPHPKSMSFGSSTSTQIFPLVAPEDTWRLGPGGTINLIEPAPMPALGHAPGYWQIFEDGELDPNPYRHG